MEILTEQTQIHKLRPNLWQAADGAVIGFGAILAPDGLYFCFTCNGPECEHTQTVNAEWLAGGHSVETEAAIPAAWWTVKGIDAFRVNRETGEVSYEDHS